MKHSNFALCAFGLATLVNLASLVGRFVPQSAVPQVLRAESFEVVDSKGQVQARITSTYTGGSLSLYRITESGSASHFAWLGSSFPGGAEFLLRDPNGSGSGFELSVDGEPSTAFLNATGGGGQPTFSLGSRTPDSSVITLWKPGSKEVVFRK